MRKAVKKQIEVEFIYFDEFVELGKQQPDANIVDNVPWAFKYKGQAITHHDDSTYLIPTPEGLMNFTPHDVLITGVNGEIYPCKLEIFEKTYDLKDPNQQSKTFNDEILSISKKLESQQRAHLLIAHDPETDKASLMIKGNAGNLTDALLSVIDHPDMIQFMMMAMPKILEKSNVFNYQP